MVACTAGQRVRSGRFCVRIHDHADSKLYSKKRGIFFDTFFCSSWTQDVKDYLVTSSALSFHYSDMLPNSQKIEIAIETGIFFIVIKLETPFYIAKMNKKFFGVKKMGYGARCKRAACPIWHIARIARGHAWPRRFKSIYQKYECFDYRDFWHTGAQDVDTYFVKKSHLTLKYSDMLPNSQKIELAIKTGKKIFTV